VLLQGKAISIVGKRGEALEEGQTITDEVKALLSTL
jgi:hypothetical protein